MQTNTPRTDAETIAALTAKCTLLAASLRQAEAEGGIRDTGFIVAREDNSAELDGDAVRAIRHALLIGLDSFGEIERVLGYLDGIKERGGEFPGLAIPRHPTESADTVASFVAALHYLK